MESGTHTSLIAGNGPAVSVVMTVINPHPVYFPEAVESVLRQTFSDLELVIVEDPSSRSAAEMLKQLDDQRIVHVTNSVRTSHSRQRNQSIAVARSEYVATIDADDICRPERIEKQLDFLRKNPEIAVVGSQLEVIDLNGQSRGWRRYPLTHAEIVACFPRFNPIAQPSVMFRKSTVVEAGGYDYDLFPAVEDYELWSRLAKRGVRFANLPEPLLKYRHHPLGMKATRLQGIIRGTLDVKQRHWQSRLGIQGKLRMWLERLLLVMPTSLTYGLFALTHTRRLPIGSAVRGQQENPANG